MGNVEQPQPQQAGADSISPEAEAASLDEFAGLLLGGNTPGDEDEADAGAQEPAVEDDVIDSEDDEDGADEEDGQPDDDADVDDAIADVIKLFDADDARYQIGDEVIGGDELKSRLLRQQDYTVKTQKLAEQRSALDAEAKAYAESLEFLGMSNAQAMAQFETVDWQQLQSTDPVKFQEARQHLQALQQREQQLKEAFGQFQSHKQAQAEQARQAQIAEAVETLQREIPGWGNELYAELKEAAKHYNIEPEVFAEQTNADFIRMLHDAHKYRTAGKKAAEALKAPTAAAVKPKPKQHGTAARKRAELSKRVRRGDKAAVRETLDNIALDLLS